LLRGCGDGLGGFEGFVLRVLRGVVGEVLRRKETVKTEPRWSWLI
jgi:hypothetical protein